MEDFYRRSRSEEAHGGGLTDFGRSCFVQASETMPAPFLPIYCANM